MATITDYHAKYFAWELEKRHPLNSHQRIAGAIANAQVKMNPHQVYAASFPFTSPLDKGAILADEVGLGKTIEAALVISQKWAERKRRIMIIAPANLRKQWNLELLDKFFLPSLILESKTYKELKKEGHNRPFDQNGKIIICSYQFASRYKEEVKSLPWDLVVLDEAHKLRNVYKTSSKTARNLKEALQDYHKILLTATPLQNSLLELYGLVSVVDEHVFGNLKSFKQQFANPKDQTDFEALRKRIGPICHRTLRKQVQHYVNYTKRVAMVEKYVPSQEEHELYFKVSDYLAKPKLWALPQSQRSLITLIMRKLLASSSFAIAGALNTMAMRLMEEVNERREENEMIASLDEDYETGDETQEEWDEDSIPEFIDTDTPEIKEIREEIEELQSIVTLAQSIQKNAKGEKLLAGLQKAFEKSQQLGAAKKAIIFTESRKTQQYLVNLLTAKEYRPEEIVLFNGTNTDPESKQLYKKWLEQNKGTDRVTGSPTADMRSAIVDYFREKATIMIATEAGAEGINLQFCSLVVNYDLPWNPQRIEQRIGRCHRYGQQHDVVVLNFLDENNTADQRVYDLLDQKFKLFEGVFGASDEILGKIGSGVDFEKRVAEIYQNCRGKEAIRAEFDRLQEEFKEEISEEMKQARTLLMENFDEEVSEKLKDIDFKAKEALAKHDQLLLQLTLHVLGEHAIHISEGTFELKTLPDNIPDANEIAIGRYELPRRSGDAYTYRSEHPLAKYVNSQALNNQLPIREMTFDYTNHTGKISTLEKFIGETGWMWMKGLKVDSMDVEEDYLLIAAVSDEWEIIDKDDAENLFRVNASLGTVLSKGDLPTEMDAALRAELEKQLTEILGEVEERNAGYFEKEIAKLEAWSDDRKSTLEEEIKDLDRQIREAKKNARNTVTLQSKLEAQKLVGSLEKERNEKRKELFEAQDQIDQEREELIQQIADKLGQAHQEMEIMVVRWKLI